MNADRSQRRQWPVLHLLRISWHSSKVADLLAFRVKDCRASRREAIIESASRQSHCFASPSDGASRGPVMMEDLALLVAVNGR
jgi:hypothetical protein